MTPPHPGPPEPLAEKGDAGGLGTRGTEVGGVPVSLVPLTAKHIPGVLTLERALVEDGTGMVSGPEDLPADEAGLRRKLAPWLARPTPGLYVVAAARRAGTVPILGSAELRRLEPAKVRHVGVLAVGVHPHHRRQGLGRALVTHLIKAAEAAGLLRLELYVMASNAPARALYASLGFEEEGVRRAFVRHSDGRWEDDLVMARVRMPG